MEFYVKISLEGLPTISSVDSARKKFPDFPQDRGDLLVTTGWDHARGICHRSGQNFFGAKVDGYDAPRGPGETITLMFDDFVPGRTADSRPEWYLLLWERILSVEAEEHYGPEQGVRVTENIVEGWAVGIVRNVPMSYGQARQFCHWVKISATGNWALADAMDLHRRILAGATK